MQKYGVNIMFDNETSRPALLQRDRTDPTARINVGRGHFCKTSERFWQENNLVMVQNT